MNYNTRAILLVRLC